MFCHHFSSKFCFKQSHLIIFEDHDVLEIHTNEQKASGRAIQKYKGGGNGSNFGTGVKRYTQTFVLHFSNRIVAKFLKVGHTVQPHSLPSLHHWHRQKATV